MNAISRRVMLLSAILLVGIFAAITPAAANTVPITTFKGAWAAKATYSPGELVTYQGGTYLCLVSNKDVPPNTHSSDWSILGAPVPGPPLVKDSKGQVVGAYLMLSNAPGSAIPTDFVFLRAFSTSFAVSFSTSQLGAGPGVAYFGILYYESSDCSGTPYFYLGGTHGDASAVLQAGVGGTIAYVMGGTPSEITGLSSIELTPGSPNGACVQVNTGVGWFYPINSMYDLSTLNLVPPYSVQ